MYDLPSMDMLKQTRVGINVYFAPCEGRAVQGDTIKPTLKALGTKRLKLQDDTLLSSFAFDFNVRRYKTSTTSAC